LDEFLGIIAGIHSRAKRSVLQYTPYQLEEKFAKGTEFKKRFVKDLGQKYALLQSMVEEKEIELQWDEEKIEWRRLNAKKKERWWETGLGGRSFAWLPMDYLP
jgi:hypothetical protein